MTRPRDEKGRFVRAEKPVRELMGDGVHDDTDALQALLDKMQGTISLPPGNYRLTGTVNIPQPIDHGPRVELRTVVLALLFLALVAAVFGGLAWGFGGGRGI